MKPLTVIEIPFLFYHVLQKRELSALYFVQWLELAFGFNKSVKLSALIYSKKIVFMLLFKHENERPRDYHDRIVQA